MPDKRRAKCRRCGRHSRECGPISWGGYCGVCGPVVFDEWNTQLHEHRGPAIVVWRRAMAASVGAVLVDDIMDAL